MWHGPKTVDPAAFPSPLAKRKYRTLFSSQRGCRPGAEGPAKELIDAVIEVKRRNPSMRRSQKSRPDVAAIFIFFSRSIAADRG
jgi:hypothetical protein